MIAKGTANIPKSITLDHHDSSTRTPGWFATGLKTPGRATPRQESAGALDRASDTLAQQTQERVTARQESDRAVPPTRKVSRCFALFNECE